MTVREAKDNNYAIELMKILPKAQACHSQIEKLKSDYEKASKEASETISKMKTAKSNPDY